MDAIAFKEDSKDRDSWSLHGEQDNSLQQLMPSLQHLKRIPSPASPTFTQSGPFCPICESSKSTEEIIRMPSCHHPICQDCLQEYLKTNIEERKVNITCPFFQCQSELPENIIEMALDPRVMEKYSRFRRENELEKDLNMRWCPRPDCEGYDIAGEDQRKLTCRVCGFLYCAVCSEEWHQGVDCQSSFLPSNVKFCPRCSVKVQRASGCSHMICTRCKYHWCWLCGKPYNSIHFMSCEFSKAELTYPRPQLICILLLLPFLAVLCVVVFAIVWLFVILRQVKRCQSKLGFPAVACVVGVMSLILSPLAFLYLCVCSGIFVMQDLGGYLSRRPGGFLSELAQKKETWAVLSIGVGTLLSPLVTVLILAGVVVSPLISVLLLLWKICTCRRKHKPVFVKNPIAGYRLGEL